MMRTCSDTPEAAGGDFPYPHRTLDAVDNDKARDAANRALIRLLLETHSQKDVLALMQCSVSGREVTHGQVRRQRRNLLAAGAERRRKNVSLMHLRDQPAADLVAADVEPEPAIKPARLPADAQRHTPREPETFESQMARLMAGAALVAAPDFRTPAPSYTLGGVASGMI